MKYLRQLLAGAWVVTSLYPVSGAGTMDNLDFWTGEWNCVWNDSIRGSNTVLKILDDKVIEENFRSFSNDFIGKSWTVYDTVSHEWKQTWVDNAGAYMKFSGSYKGDTLVLNQEDPMTLIGHKIYRRMIFYSIKNDSFEWQWESSDDGSNWNSKWHITYMRKP